MKRKCKRILLAVLAVVATLFALCGCSFNRTVDQIKDSYGLTAKVVYHANGGQFGANASDTVKEIYYKDNTIALDIGAKDIVFSSGKPQFSRAGYVFDGWYYPELSGGKVQYLDDAKTQVKLDLERKVDFTTPIRTGEEWQIYAKWKAVATVDVIAVCAEGETFSGVDILGGKRENIQNGSIVYSYEFDSDSKVTERTAAPLKSVDGKTHTFLAFYADVECTQSVSWPIAFPEENDAGEIVNPVIYAKYIKGDWTVLKTPEDIKNKFLPYVFSATKKFYLFQDIDCSGWATPVNKLMKTFAAELQGNGHTISGLHIALTGVKSDIDVENLSLFGAIQATAKLQNVTFKNVNITLETARPTTEINCNVNFAFSSIADEAKANVTDVLVGGELKVIYDGSWNFVDGGNFGGYATDEEYTTECPDGIKAENASIVIEKKSK